LVCLSAFTQATYTNTSGAPVTEFVLQAAVPKFMQLRLAPASGTTLTAGGTDTVSQAIQLNNTMHGQKAIIMRLRITYKRADGEAVLEQAEVKNFPSGL
jgi:AP-1 complex subunit gamma-1